MESKKRTYFKRKSSKSETLNSDKGAIRIIEQSKNQPLASSTRPLWMIELFECTICLDCYENNQSIMGLPCGHNYHQECIDEWLTRGNHCCPICRWPSYRFQHPRQKKIII